MRVCILTTSYPRWRDDLSGHFVEALARKLPELGWDVRVVAPHYPGTPRRESAGGVEVIRFRYAWPEGLERLCYDGGIPANLKARPWTALLVPPFLGAFRHAARAAAKDCDVIHCHWTVSALAGLPAGTRWKVPVIVTALGSDLSLGEGSSALRRLNRRVVGKADMVVAIGMQQLAVLAELGCPPQRSGLIPLGINDQFLADPPHAEKSTDVLFVGRMSPEKRPGLLLDALACLARSGKAVAAEFVGGGMLLPELQQRIKSEGLANVHLLGMLPEHAQVVQAMDRARCLALVSTREGMPNVILEAMARGLAVVACDVGSVRDIVKDGVTGVLLAPDVSAETLAKAIGDLLADSARLQSMGLAGRAFVEGRYSWGQTARKYDELYRQLTSRPRT